MQNVFVGIGLLIALAPIAISKRLSVGDSRTIRNFRRVLFLIAIFSGGAAMGCWLLTQSDAGVAPNEGAVIVATLFCSPIAFLAALVGSSFLANRKQGLPTVLRSTLFLIGVCGLCVLAFFVVSSRGAIFLFGPLPSIVLLISLLCVTSFWRAVVTFPPRSRVTG
jgi:hypothetical protein